MNLVYEGLRLDLLLGQVHRDGHTEDLSTMEVRLVAWLHGHADGWVTNEELLRHVWGYAPAARSHTVRTTVSRLRAKIEVDPKLPRVLLSETGRGYRLVLPKAPASAMRRPTRADAFVGREAALAWLCEHATPGAVLAVVGPGGIGKTRLLEQFVGSRHTAFVDCVGCDEPAAVLRRIASALGLKGTADLPRRVGSTLSAQGVHTIVLDDVDGLWASWPALWQPCRPYAPEATVLGVGRRHPVEPGLPVLHLGPLTREAAMALVASRSSQASTPELAPLVEALDRVPLALELAAACLDVLTARELAQRIRREESLGVAAAMAVSWAQLRSEERQALHQLRVFADTFSADAAEGVLAADAPLGTLRVLLQRSVLHRGAYEERYRLLHPIRELLAERCGPVPDDVRHRHALWFAQRAEPAVAAWRSDEQLSAHGWLTREMPDIRAATRWAVARRHPVSPTLAVAWAEWSSSAGQPGPRDALEMVLDGQSEPGASTADLLLALGRCEAIDGRPAKREAWSRRARAAVAPGTERHHEATLELARARLMAGHPEDARALLATMETVEPGSVHHLGALRVRGDVAVAMGDRAEAVAAYRAAVAGAAERGWVGRWAFAAVRLATVLGDAGERGESLALLDRVVAASEAHGLARPLGAALLRRGGLRADSGDRLQGVADLKRAASQCDATGDVRQQARVLFRQGLLLREVSGADAEEILRTARRRLASLDLQGSLLDAAICSALATTMADRQDAASALHMVEAVGDPALLPPAVQATVWRERALVLGVAGRVEEGCAAARAADVGVRGSGVLMAEVEAAAVLAAFGDGGAIRRLEDFPDDATPHLQVLQRAIRREASKVDTEQWLLARMLPRIATKSC